MRNGHNVIILICDTLRSNHLGCYNSEMDTPAFDSAAADGVLFESAFSTAPGTPVSHASLYTGQYPSEHGVTGQYLDLPTDVPVIAEWFRDAGYDTFGITGPGKMGSDWNYDRGFDDLYEWYYDRPSLLSREGIMKAISDPKFLRFYYRRMTRGDNLTRYKFDMIRERIQSELDAPYFVLCNFLTVHAPYDPPRPYKKRANPDYSRPMVYLLEHFFEDPRAVNDPDIRYERIRHLQNQTSDAVGRYLDDPDYFNDKEIQFLRNWYNAAVQFLDDELERFLEFYRRELQDDTILILTADHGEQLGERGLWEHSHYFYDETVKIPLIMLGPQSPACTRRSDLASHVDIFDTLCDCCGLERPETTSGISLFSDEERSAVFMEYGERDIDDFATKSGHGRYLDPDKLRELSAGRKAIRTKQYQLEIDSNGNERLLTVPEQTEISDPPADVLADLRERLFDTLGDEYGVWPEGKPDEDTLTEQLEENLARLGYID